MHPDSTPLEQRFWAKVRKTDTCWIWTASKNNKGYGWFRVGGQRGKTKLAHRVAWELIVGPLPADRCVLPRCDVPLCVRPDHLFLGSKAENSRDMVRKGRSTKGFASTPWDRIPRGERHSNSKLTEADVLEIRSLRGILSQVKIARRYSVSPATVSEIHRRLIWKHVN